MPPALGLRAVIVVPHGNSREKNAAMRALGAELIEHGHDFQDAFEHAAALAARERLHFVRSFDEALVRGVASYAMELFEAVPNLDAVYVPIGMGSGICGTIAARDALGLSTEIVGVVAASAPAYALSFAAGRPVSPKSPPDHRRRHGLPRARSLRLCAVDPGGRRARGHGGGVPRFDPPCGIFSPIRITLAEGAGAAALAALLQERERMRGAASP